MGPFGVASVYRYKSISQNNEGHGIFHDMVGQSVAMGPVETIGGDDKKAFTTYEDADGDQIFESSVGEFTEESSGIGSFTLHGGTGKYRGITGEGKMEFGALNYNYHDPDNPNPSGPVQSKAIRRGQYRIEPKP